MSEDADEVTCAVVACPNNFKPENSEQNREDLTYHRFPRDPTMKAAWTKACMRPKNWDKADFAYVCSDHFDPTDFNYPDPGSHEVYLSPEAIPSTRIKFSIKTEPIDVEDDYQELINQEGLDIVMGAEGELDSSDLLPMIQDHQLVYDQNESIFLDNNDADRRTCTKCAREFKTEGRLKRHELFCILSDRKGKMGPRANSGTACFVKNCPAKFYHRNKMLKHMELVHNYLVDEKQKLKFASMEEFWTWKENEEERTYSYFSKRTGNHKNTSTYHCQRDGPSRATHGKSENPRVLKRQMSKGNIKENIVCLAHIKTTLNSDGTVTAVYFPSHNHPLSAMDYLHHPLSRGTQMFIREKLELGYTPKQIADELLVRQNASAPRDAPTNMTKNQFLHMVNKLDRIRGFLDRERKRVKEEASGTAPPRVRRSRKVILEEQFQKSKQYQEEVRQGRKYLDDTGDFDDDDISMSVDHDRLDQHQSYSEMYQENFGDQDDDGETVDGDYAAEERERNEVGEILGTDDLLRTLEGATGVLCKQEDVVQELVLDESGHVSSQPVDYKALYQEAVAVNGKLSSTVEILQKRLDKQEKQINLLLSALKKSLSKDHADLETLKETVSDGDYEIIVI
ncbi:hypothetical protein GE061_013416 [Apolygus lucorum]|uniref:Uncharacterized protein n=1 Tax=Apolygus lucorum TaxID=248454 RepID=A0A6A4KCH6_APOLU|nr:hypothetical protein GE061_013416 [Apolygus lucorum]